MSTDGLHMASPTSQFCKLKVIDPKFLYDLQQSMSRYPPKITAAFVINNLEIRKKTSAVAPNRSSLNLSR